MLRPVGRLSRRQSLSRIVAQAMARARSVLVLLLLVLVLLLLLHEAKVVRIHCVIGMEAARHDRLLARLDDSVILLGGHRGGGRRGVSITVVGWPVEFVHASDW